VEKGGGGDYDDCLLVFFKCLAKEVKLCCRFTWSWSSIVSIVTGLRGLDGAEFEMGKRFFSSPQCPHWLRGPPSLQLSGYHCTFLGFKGLWHEMMTHSHVVPSLEVYLLLTICLFVVWKGTTLPLVSYYMQHCMRSLRRVVYITCYLNSNKQELPACFPGFSVVLLLILGLKIDVFWT
jgi:hypothetical protein